MNNNNDQPVTIDDPRLTAFALGQLGEAEAKAVELAVENSAELRAAVDEIRAMGEALTEGLKGDAGQGLTTQQRTAIESAISDRPKAAPVGRKRRWIVPLAAAASLIIVVGAGFMSLPSLSRSRELRIVGNYNPPDTTAVRGLPLNEREATTPTAQRVQKKGSEAGKSRKATRETVARQRESSPATVVMARPKPSQVRGQMDQARAVRRLKTRAGANKSAGGRMSDQVAAYQASAPRPQFDETYDGSPPPNVDVRHPARKMRPAGAGHAYVLDGRAGRERGRWNDPPYRIGDTESYDAVSDNPFKYVTRHPLSTFAIDVDTASYANVRRFLSRGQLPPAGAVRIEEMINYFDYNYPRPDGEHPFSVNVEIATCPWTPSHRLARIGLQGYEFDAADRPPANLVFLIDVSGSMNVFNKLPLVKQGLAMLVHELGGDDSIAIVTYAGSSSVALEPTACRHETVILDTIDRLSAGGSTNGGAGIELAYGLAEQTFIKGGINRVILATDGDFNVGITNQSRLVRLIEDKAKSGVFLSVLGFGMGNLKDSTLEKLADKGNGHYAYIDDINEAEKVLVREMGGSLMTIAKDVKIQVEFNPARVSAYRLIGYENRMLRDRDFNDDTKDAGEIGAGRRVTALYELVPGGLGTNAGGMDPLKYQRPKRNDGLEVVESDELMTVKLRYKEPDGDVSKLMEVSVVDDGAPFVEASDDFALAASAAAFGMLLRGSTHCGGFTYRDVLKMAENAIGKDPHGYRHELCNLVEKTIAIQEVGRR